MQASTCVKVILTTFTIVTLRRDNASKGYRLCEPLP